VKNSRPGETGGGCTTFENGEKPSPPILPRRKKGRKVAFCLSGRKARFLGQGPEKGKKEKGKKTRRPWPIHNQKKLSAAPTGGQRAPQEKERRPLEEKEATAPLVKSEGPEEKKGKRPGHSERPKAKSHMPGKGCRNCRKKNAWEKGQMKIIGRGGQRKKKKL